MSNLNHYLNNINSMFRHLHGVIGGEINQLDSTYIKGQNVKPHVNKTHTLQRQSMFQQLSGSLFSQLGKGIGSTLADEFSGSDLGSMGFSNSQMWSQIGSAISRAMKRNL